MPEGEALLGRNCKQLICAVVQGNIVSDERKQPGAVCQTHSQRPGMTQSSRLSNCCATACQCLVGKPEAEKDNPQMGL
jgi:hypothetical protein